MRTTLHFAAHKDDNMERAAEPAQPRLASILDSISDAFFALDASWRFIYVNNAAVDILTRLQLGCDDLVGKYIWTEFPDVVGSRFEEQCRRAMASQQSIEFEDFYSRLQTWFAIRITPAPDGISLYFQDVTERKQTEEVLRERNMLLRAVIDSTTDAVFVKALDGRYLVVNDAAARYLGTTVETALGRDNTAFFLPEVAELTMAHDRAVMEADLSQTYEETVTVEGETRTYLSTKVLTAVTTAPSSGL